MRRRVSNDDQVIGLRDVRSATGLVAGAKDEASKHDGHSPTRWVLDSAGVRVRLNPQEPVEQLLPQVLVRQAMAGGGPLLVEGRYALRRYTDDPYLRQLDTGAVLYQSVSQFAPTDNISTYQYRQMADAIPLMIRAADDALAGQLRVQRNALPSKQWFMPTLWGYFRTGLLTGVW